MNFEGIIQKEQSLILESRIKMTSQQRRKVSSMGRNGWDIVKQDGDKIVMSKDGKEVFVYSTGKTFFLSETEEIDVTDIIDFLEESENIEIINENFIKGIFLKLKRKNPKLTVYSDGTGAIAVVRNADGTLSLCHVIKRKVKFESDSITRDQIKNYLSDHPSYNKIIDKQKAFRIFMVTGIMLLSVAAGGSLAFLATRAIGAAIGLGAEVFRPEKFILDDESTRKTIVSRIDNLVKVKSGEFELDMDTADRMEYTSSEHFSSYKVSDVLATTAVGGMGTNAIATTEFR